MTTTGEDLRPPVPGQPTNGQRWAGRRATEVWDSLWSLIASTAGLGVALYVVPGVHVESWWAVLLVAVVVTVGDTVLRTPLRILARRFGPGAAILLGLVAQLAVAWVALTLLPGIRTDSPGDVVLVLVIAAVVMVVGRWLIGLRDNDYALGDLRRRARRGARRQRGMARTRTRPGRVVERPRGCS